ncbi:hypothetical protein GCM10010317_102140 [Streptomyces mirabilis]|nr:hypothetical protein GCM10010317_102140 [Streptomyces mirabilis]
MTAQRAVSTPARTVWTALRHQTLGTADSHRWLGQCRYPPAIDGADCRHGADRRPVRARADRVHNRPDGAKCIEEAVIPPGHTGPLIDRCQPGRCPNSVITP